MLWLTLGHLLNGSSFNQACGYKSSKMVTWLDYLRPRLKKGSSNYGSELAEVETHEEQTKAQRGSILEMRNLVGP
jgi:hypothetical protein